MKKIFSILTVTFAMSSFAQEKSQTITGSASGGGGISITSIPIRYEDSTKFVKKAISQELNLTQALDVLVDLTTDLTIKTWNDNKVRVETSVRYEGENELSDEQWLAKTGVSLRIFGNTVKVTSKPPFSFTFAMGAQQQAKETVFWGNGNNHGLLKGDRGITLYIPSGSKLEVENKFGRVKISNPIKELLLYNTNGHVEAGDIGRLQMRSIQGSLSAGSVTDGDINIAHGRMTLKELGKGTLMGSYNTIEIEKVGTVRVNSNSDDIDINQSAALSGTKNYGSLRINNSGDIELEGMSSNVNLRDISMSAKTIKIFNRNADLRLPVRNIKSYTIDVKGSFNTFYADFLDKMEVDTLTTREVEDIQQRIGKVLDASKMISSNSPLTVQGRPANLQRYDLAGHVSLTESANKSKNNLRYSVKSGEGANPVSIDITCTNCTLDFK
jgi:hypothetical protein